MNLDDIATIAYQDDFHVWSALEAELLARLPLSGVSFRCKGGIRQVTSLPVEFRPAANAKPVSPLPHHWHLRPYVSLFVAAGDDTEVYKQRVRPKLLEWLRVMNDRPLGSTAPAQPPHAVHEWAVVYVVMPGAGTQHSSALSKLNPLAPSRSPQKVLEKMRGDVKKDRLCLVKLGEEGEHWNDLMKLLAETMSAAIDQRCLQFEEELRRIESNRLLPGWNFLNFFATKEAFAFFYEQVQLSEESLREYDELDAFFLEYKKSGHNLVTPGFGFPGTDSRSVLQASQQQFRTAIELNTITEFELRVYIFGRQAHVIEQLKLPLKFLKRGIEFVDTILTEMRAQRVREPFLQSWTYSAILEIGQEANYLASTVTAESADQFYALLGSFYLRARDALTSLGNVVAFGSPLKAFYIPVSFVVEKTPSPPTPSPPTLSDTAVKHLSTPILRTLDAGMLFPLPPVEPGTPPVPRKGGLMPFSPTHEALVSVPHPSESSGQSSAPASGSGAEKSTITRPEIAEATSSTELAEALGSLPAFHNRWISVTQLAAQAFQDAGANRSRHVALLTAQAASIYYLSEDYEQAEPLLKAVSLAFSEQGWNELFFSVASKLAVCQRQQRHFLDYAVSCLTLVAHSASRPRDEIDFYMKELALIARSRLASHSTKDLSLVLELDDFTFSRRFAGPEINKSEIFRRRIFRPHLHHFTVGQHLLLSVSFTSRLPQSVVFDALSLRLHEIDRRQRSLLERTVTLTFREVAVSPGSNTFHFPFEALHKGDWICDLFSADIGKLSLTAHITDKQISAGILSISDSHSPLGVTLLSPHLLRGATQTVGVEICVNSDNIASGLIRIGATQRSLTLKSLGQSCSQQLRAATAQQFEAREQEAYLRQAEQITSRGGSAPRSQSPMSTPLGVQVSVAGEATQRSAEGDDDMALELYSARQQREVEEQARHEKEASLLAAEPGDAVTLSIDSTSIPAIAVTEAISDAVSPLGSLGVASPVPLSPRSPGTIPSPLLNFSSHVTPLVEPATPKPALSASQRRVVERQLLGEFMRHSRADALQSLDARGMAEKVAEWGLPGLSSQFLSRNISGRQFLRLTEADLSFVTSAESDFLMSKIEEELQLQQADGLSEDMQTPTKPAAPAQVRTPENSESMMFCQVAAVPTGGKVHLEIVLESEARGVSESSFFSVRGQSSSLLLDFSFTRDNGESLTVRRKVPLRFFDPFEISASLHSSGPAKIFFCIRVRSTAPIALTLFAHSLAFPGGELAVTADPNTRLEGHSLQPEGEVSYLFQLSRTVKDATAVAYQFSLPFSFCATTGESSHELRHTHSISGTVQLPSAAIQPRVVVKFEREGRVGVPSLMTLLLQRGDGGESETLSVKYSVAYDPTRWVLVGKTRSTLTEKSSVTLKLTPLECGFVPLPRVSVTTINATDVVCVHEAQTLAVSPAKWQVVSLGVPAKPVQL
eukprot:TRINITY_DN5871_c0_g1_i7.p1 TRINITY_DN5871_c0_g1~~TRINITY_DN5871_c0_g1_i7.p1  ORF type:complete len:1453 (-),score=285.51 TRINITY_DN5871_c0_g1_i7:21-4379(-)